MLPAGKFVVENEPGIANSEILNKYSDFDVLLIRSTRKISSAFIEKCNFKVIATFTKGTDHIDAGAAAKKGIKILNAEEGNHISAAEHTMALMLSASKNLLLADEKVRKGKFTETDFRRFELRGKTVGIIGYGKVGSYTGRLCKVFGMRVIANDISKAVREKHSGTVFVKLEKLLKESDIVTLHIPYSEENHEFIAGREFDQMKETSVFINTSRGKVVNEADLINRLKSGRLYFAGLDVFYDEPEVDRRLLKMRNVILSNHVAGKTSESRERISSLIFKKLREIFSG